MRRLISPNNGGLFNSSAVAPSEDSPSELSQFLAERVSLILNSSNEDPISQVPCRPTNGTHIVKVDSPSKPSL